MRLSALLLCLAASASAQVVVDPVPVVYLPGGASVEECRRQWRTTAPVRAHTAPTLISDAVRTVDADRRVDGNDYTESLTAVLRPGLARVRQALTIEGIRVGGGSGFEAVVFGAGDEIELFGIEGEGFGFFGHQGAIYSGQIPGYSIRTGEPDEVEVVRDAVEETWVFLVSYGADRPASWLNVSQAGLVERETTCG